MAKDKLNHRNKSKKAREYKELDLKQFDDIIKKPKKGNFKDKRKDKKGYKERQDKPYKKVEKKPYKKWDKDRKYPKKEK